MIFLLTKFRNIFPISINEEISIDEREYNNKKTTITVRINLDLFSTT